MDEQLAATKRTPEKRPVITVTLDDLLGKLGVEHVDILSMDIETAEPFARSALKIDKYRPRLAVVETLDEVKADIYRY